MTQQHFVVRLPGGSLLWSSAINSFHVYTNQATAETWARIYNGTVEAVKLEFLK